jgi:cytochrome oxidase Cu insertion factor (SCO1/SenC/PrrC family)
MASESDAGRPTMTPFLAALAIIVLVVIAIGLFNFFGDDELPANQQVARAAVGQNDALQRQDYTAFRSYTLPTNAIQCPGTVNGLSMTSPMW